MEASLQGHWRFIFSLITALLLSTISLQSQTTVTTSQFYAATLYVPGAKQFRIDHPLDPANRYLNHASVESSEIKNFYDGVAVLDNAGETRVSLPGWFEVLNRDYRYQLTAIGAPAPGLYIADEIHGNGFRIAGGQPNMKVSWAVTGIRQDAYAKAHPLEVEAEKPDGDKGLYIDATVYGLPASLSLPLPPVRTKASQGGNQ